MDVYTSEAVDFFSVVLTSGAIAIAALVMASAIAFALVFLLFREGSAATVPGRVATAVTPEQGSAAPNTPIVSPEAPSPVPG